MCLVKLVLLGIAIGNFVSVFIIAVTVLLVVCLAVQFTLLNLCMKNFD